MSRPDGLIEQMVVDIETLAYQLDDQRLEMFLGWLTAHSVEMKRSIGNILEMESTAHRGADMRARFKSALKNWLVSLSPEGLLWEYRAILDEIDWWGDLDPFRLKGITREEEEEDG